MKSCEQTPDLLTGEITSGVMAYPPEFDVLWAMYPRRNGSNPKKKAFGAYRSRLREGHSPTDISAGLERYVRWCEDTEKTDTEYVMQASRFFGPGEEFLNPWTSPIAIKLPRDNFTLWDIRVRLGIEPFFDDVESCHREIRTHLRDHPEKLALLGSAR
jgi:hypothetical protein